MEIQSPGHKTMCWALPRRDHAALGWEQNPKGFFGGGGGFVPTPQLDLVPPSHPTEPREQRNVLSSKLGFLGIAKSRGSSDPTARSCTCQLRVPAPRCLSPSPLGWHRALSPACHQHGVSCQQPCPVGSAGVWSQLDPLSATLCHSTGCPLCSLALSLWANTGHGPPEPALGGPRGPQCHSGEVSPQEVPPQGSGVPWGVPVSPQALALHPLLSLSGVTRVPWVP